MDRTEREKAKRMGLPLFVTIEHKKKERQETAAFFFICSRRVTHQDK